MKITIDLPTIEGYEYTGEYRKPLEGEYSAHIIDKPVAYKSGSYSPYPEFILRKLVTYRSVQWPQDHGKEIEFSCTRAFNSPRTATADLVGKMPNGWFIATDPEQSIQIFEYARVEE